MKTLIMTTTINTQGCAYLAYTDVDRRQHDYREALRRYLAYDGFNIVMSENSMASFDFLGDLRGHPRVELLTFDGNGETRSLGKGHGENKSITNALINSKFLAESDYFFKVSGRYFSTEIPGILTTHDHAYDGLFEDIPGHKDRGHVLTVFFGMRKKLYLDRVSNATVNDGVGRILEWVMFQEIKDLNVKWIPPVLYEPTIIGGSMQTVTRFPA